MMDWVQQVLLFSTVHCEFAFYFSAYTEKDRGGGLGLGLGWVGLLVHHIFFIFFWNACMVVYGFAWFDRVDSFGEKK